MRKNSQTLQNLTPPHDNESPPSGQTSFSSKTITRSRSNSSTSDSDSDSNSNSQKKPKKVVKKYSRSEVEALKELELNSRRNLITCLNNKNVATVVAQTFPRMSPNHESFSKLMKRVSSLWKTWKHRITKQGDSWVKKFLKYHPDAKNCETFRAFRTYVSEQYEDHWLPDVFKFARDAVDFKEVSELGRTWLACKYPFLAFICV